MVGIDRKVMKMRDNNIDGKKRYWTVWSGVQW